MSVEAMAIALHHSRAVGTARLVLLGIANHDGDGGSWPAIGTLAKYAGGVDRKTVKRAIDKLEELHEVEQLDREGGDRNTPDHLRPNLYRFLLQCPPDCDRSRNHRTKRGAGSSLPEPLDLSTPGAPTPRGRRDPGAPTPRDPGAPTPPEPSLEPNHQDTAVEPTVTRASVCSITGDAHEVSARYGRCVYCGESMKP